jgi:hypothetical protein
VKEAFDAQSTARAQMSTLARAWDAFMRAIEEARALTISGAEPPVIAEVVRHARELLEIIEAEIAAHPIAIPGAAGAVLMRLRGRLQSLEKDVMPTRH